MGRPKKIKTEEVTDSNVATLEPETVTEVVEVKEEVKKVVEPVVEKASTASVLERHYDTLFSRGLLLHLHISRWGMSTRLNEADLEIEKVPEIIRLGKKYLIKPAIFNKFAQIEQKARIYLKSVSRPFPIAQANFVPLENVNDAYNQIVTYQTEYDQLSDDFVTNYEANKEEALTAYPDYAEALRKAYPPIAELRAKFSFDIQMFRINMPKEHQEVNIGKLLKEEQEIESSVKEVKTKFEAQAEKQLSEITDFVSNSIKELRQDVDGVFAIIINKINKGEVVSDANKNTLARKIQDFEKLNIFGDLALAERIESVKAFLAENRDLKDKENVEDRDALKNFLLEAKTVAQNTSDISNLTGEYFRALEI